MLPSPLEDLDRTASSPSYRSGSSDLASHDSDMDAEFAQPPLPVPQTQAVPFPSQPLPQRPLVPSEALLQPIASRPVFKSDPMADLSLISAPMFPAFQQPYAWDEFLY